MANSNEVRLDFSHYWEYSKTGLNSGFGLLSFALYEDPAGDPDSTAALAINGYIWVTKAPSNFNTMYYQLAQFCSLQLEEMGQLCLLLLLRGDMSRLLSGG